MSRLTEFGYKMINFSENGYITTQITLCNVDLRLKSYINSLNIWIIDGKVILL